MVDDGKRYYWLKLKEDFFQDEAIEWLEEQTNGKDYVLFYLKLCLKSLKSNGFLIRQVGNMLVPYNVEKLAEITKTSVDTVAVALKVLKQIGLIDIQESGQLYLTQLKTMVGNETESARRKREQRAKQIGTNLGQEWDIVPQSIENRDKSIENRDKSIENRDKSIEIEKEKEIQEQNVPRIVDDSSSSSKKSTRHKYGSYQNVLLSDEELKTLKEEYDDWFERIERLSEYIASSGKKYKNFLATIRSWARKEKGNTPKSKKGLTEIAKELDAFWEGD